jgi:uncharacterized delta-60 repeat protein
MNSFTTRLSLVPAIAPSASPRCASTVRSPRGFTAGWFRQALASLAMAAGLFAPAQAFGQVVLSDVRDTAVLPDGKIMAVGSFETLSGVARIRIARLNPDLSVDTTFTASAANTLHAVAVQADGKILIGGVATIVNGDSNVKKLARLNAVGTLDSTFNHGPNLLNNDVFSIAVQPDGRILIGGGFTSVNGSAVSTTTGVNRIARLNANGTLDTTFNSGLGGANQVVYSIAVQPDGKILIGGGFTSVNGSTVNTTTGVNYIARLNEDGTLDTTFNSGLGGADNGVFSIAVQPDGKILIAGYFTSVNGSAVSPTTGVNRIARLNANGTLDTTFNNGLGGANSTVYDVAVQADGKIVIGGDFTSVNGTTGVNRIARLNADGTLDTTFNSGKSGANKIVYSVAVKPDGTVVLGGDFTSVNGLARDKMATLSPAPEVTTPTSTALTATTATLGGNVAAEGESTITERGVVYSLTSTNADPLISGSGVTKATTTGTTGVFTVPVTGLTPGGAYSFKAYAINSFGTAYTSVGTFSFAPEIAVEQPAGSNLTSGTATVAFGTAATGAAAVKTFTVKNTGLAPLTLGTITFTGTNAGDFTVTTAPVSPVAATNGSTTFTVTFRPGAAGARSATLNLPSNDTTGGENPFVIALSGSGTDTAVTASFISVTGGQLVGSTFTIGSVGTINPSNNWPAAESPAQATDGNAATKFLIFQSSGAGLVLTPANPALAYNRLALTTANDGPERDPASYSIYGSSTVLPTSGTIATNTLTLIQQGTLALHTDRGVGPHVVQFANTTAYASYLVAFPTVRNPAGNNLTQIAEVKLSQGMTVRSQVAMGTARGGRLSGNTFTFGTAGLTNPGTNWVPTQSPDNALDGDVSATYLLFQNNGMGLIASPAGGGSEVVNQLSFWTAGDAPERDPVSYAVYGFDTLVTQTTGTLPVGTAIATGTLTLPTERGAGPTTVNFTNTNAYASYLVVFPAVRSTSGNNITQIGEIAFAYVPPASAPLVSTPTSADITVTTATLGGNVTSEGTSPVTERGVVYALTSANANPEINGSGVTKVTTTGTTGVFTMPVTALTGGRGYSFKAYAINGVGTTYTTPVATFSTLHVPPAGTDNTLSVLAGSTTTLTAADWGFSDADTPPDTFSAVKLTTLPATGTLAVNGTPATAGQMVALLPSPAGETWTEREPTGYWRAMTSSADGTNLAAIDQNARIHTSADAGATWTARDSYRNWASIASSADGAKLAAVVQEGQIYTSTNSGATWTAQESDRDWRAIASSADGTKLAAVVQSGRVFTSSDSGATWTAGESNRVWFSITSSADGTKLAAVAGGDKIYLSTDAGATWTPRESNRFWYSITSSADGTKLAAVVYGGQVFTSTDSGASWTPRASNQDWTAITSSADGTKLAAVTYGGQIHTSTDSGATWTARESIRNWRAIASSADGTKLVAGANPSKIYTSSGLTPVITYTAPAGTGSASFTFQVQDDASAENLDLSPNTLTFNYAPPTTAPVVSTPTNADVLATSATLGGNVTSDGGSAITERGVVYALTSANTNPEIGGSGVTKVTTTGTTGVFTVSVTGLTASSGYSFKAYAINGVGTNYTSAATFTTAAAEILETVSIGGTNVLAVADIGGAATVPELLNGQTIITGTVNGETTTDAITFTLPSGKAVVSGTLVVSNYVAPNPPFGSGQQVLSSQVGYQSSSALNTRFSGQTDSSLTISAPTRCNANTFTVTVSVPVEVYQQMTFIPPSTFIPGGYNTFYGSASYTLTLEIGDQDTNSTLADLSATEVTLSPAFATGTTLYSGTVSNAQSYVLLTPSFTPAQYVTTALNGGEATDMESMSASFYDLNVGLNTIVIHVCAQDGTEMNYTVNVTREAAPPPNENPTFPGYSFTMRGNTEAFIDKDRILALAADSDGGTPAIQEFSILSAQNFVADYVAARGSLKYHPATNAFTGADSFPITITDGQGGSVVGQINVTVLPADGPAGSATLIEALPTGDISLVFLGSPGLRYLIQRSASLVNPSWEDLTTVTAGPDGRIEFVDPNPGEIKFYRTVEGFGD